MVCKCMLMLIMIQLAFWYYPKKIDETLYNAFGQSQVSTMYMPMNQYYVVMEVAPKYWQYPET